MSERGRQEGQNQGTMMSEKKREVRPVLGSSHELRDQAVVEARKGKAQTDFHLEQGSPTPGVQCPMMRGGADVIIIIQISAQ